MTTAIPKNLRRLFGMCLKCGEEEATHPNLDGFKDRAGYRSGRIPMAAPAHIKEKYPPVCCDLCWPDWLAYVAANPFLDGEELDA